MQIGPYRLPTPLLLAPMAGGGSELPFRLFVLEMGAGLASTELVSCEGLVRRQVRTLRFLRHDPARERPFCVQLFGGDPQRMALAARVAQEQGAKIIDVNMGCPVPKVTRNGSGSALMAEPERAAAIVTAIREATDLPVTVKIRSGWDARSLNAVPFALQMERAGACAIAVHPRTRAQAYSGRSDWSVIKAVKEAVRVPVIGNGDVHGKADAERMIGETGCDGVMIGRAALGNPWIFREVLGGPAPTCAERRAGVLRHFEEHLAFVGEPVNGVRSFRQPLLCYARGLRGAAHFRVQATRLDSPDEVRRAIDRFFSEAEPDRSAPEEEIETDGAFD
ncbi:MAG: tRNA dihydrouridine synthase DusB [Deltaproteobacteria bacterium]|nr:tRNA dihydrouridine synthase DusB [Deltaproteobacteria bacterium]